MQERKLMQVEEQLTSEQAKCSEVIKARCTPLESELSSLRRSEVKLQNEVKALRV
jgi:hypothetical protein